MFRPESEEAGKKKKKSKNKNRIPITSRKMPTS